MRTTGIQRKMDDLGRVVVPMEIRRSMNIDVKDLLDIYVEDDKIILKKSGVSCVFCGASTEIRQFKNRSVCAACVKEITEQGG